jgi:hypothetical protein
MDVRLSANPTSAQSAQGICQYAFHAFCKRCRQPVFEVALRLVPALASAVGLAKPIMVVPTGGVILTLAKPARMILIPSWKIPI